MHRMEGKDVNPATIAVVVEANFDPDGPRQGAEQLCHRLLDGGVRGIDQAVQLFALPPNLDLDGCAQRRRNAVDRAKRHAGHVAPLHSRYELSRDAGSGAENSLWPGSAESQETNGPRNVGVHRAIVGAGSYRPITNRPISHEACVRFVEPALERSNSRLA